MEGTFEARALLYVPARAPFDLYHPEMSRKGLQLYVKRIFILDDCRDLMPNYLRFIKGVIDAEDLSLNVSREMLQENRQIRAIRKHLTKKVVESLTELRKSDRDKYVAFWGQFGPVLKEGLVPWGEEKQDRIYDLILCQSTREEDEWTTLEEYVERMKEGQEAIYFLTGATKEAALHSPHLEAFRDKGYEVLLLTDRVDEVWSQQPQEFQGKKFQSIGQGEVELGDEEEKKKTQEELEEKRKVYSDLIEKIQSLLDERVKEVRLSTRLTSSASCLVGEKGDLSPQLEAILRESGQEMPRVKRILELNPKHAVIERLQQRFAANADDPAIADYAELLYGQAVLAEGSELEDPAEFSRRVTELMAKAL
jgi:molecular chaperone HtpG